MIRMDGWMGDTYRILFSATIVAHECDWIDPGWAVAKCPDKRNRIFIILLLDEDRGSKSIGKHGD
jgi:hypothetical protein